MKTLLRNSTDVCTRYWMISSNGATRIRKRSRHAGFREVDLPRATSLRRNRVCAPWPSLRPSPNSARWRNSKGAPTARASRPWRWFRRPNNLPDGHSFSSSVIATNVLIRARRSVSPADLRVLRKRRVCPAGPNCTCCPNHAATPCRKPSDPSSGLRCGSKQNYSKCQFANPQPPPLTAC